jgi:hypothetical protein
LHITHRRLIHGAVQGFAVQSLMLVAIAAGGSTRPVSAVAMTLFGSTHGDQVGGIFLGGGVLLALLRVGAYSQPDVSKQSAKNT